MKKTFFLTFGIVILVFVHAETQAVHGQNKPDTSKETCYEIKKGLTYFAGENASENYHKLDIYLPKNRKAGVKVPVVFWVHGGSWIGSDKAGKGELAMAEVLTKNGIGMVSINYRPSNVFGSGAKHPDHIEDVARALAWCVTHIDRYGGSSKKLFVAGHSAGAHLISLLSTDHRYLKAQGLTCKNFCGVIALSGIYDLTKMSIPPYWAFDQAVCKEASPIFCKHHPNVPFLLLCAENDYEDCRPEKARAFRDVLQKRKVRVSFEVVPRCNHNSILEDINKDGNPLAKIIPDFIRAHAP